MPLKTPYLKLIKREQLEECTQFTYECQFCNKESKTCSCGDHVELNCKYAKEALENEIKLAKNRSESLKKLDKMDEIKQEEVKLIEPLDMKLAMTLILDTVGIIAQYMTIVAEACNKTAKTADRLLEQFEKREKDNVD